MLRELTFYGLLIPPLLVWVCAALAITAVVRRLLRGVGFYRCVWHRPLFDAALLVIVVGGVAALSSWLDIL